MMELNAAADQPGLACMLCNHSVKMFQSVNVQYSCTDPIFLKCICSLYLKYFKNNQPLLNKTLIL